MARLEINSPMDLIGVYLMPQIGVGQSLNINTIQKRLKSLPLSRTLAVLAQIAYRADKSVSREDRIELANALLRPVYANKAIQMINSNSRERYFVVASQIVVGLGLHALVHCTDEDTGIEDQELIYEIGDLLLALAGTLDGKVTGRDGVLMDLVRMDIWYKVHDVDRWYELAHSLIFDILPTLDKEKDWIDYRKLIENATGMTLEVFWALTNSMAVYTDSDPKNGYIFPPNVQSEHISKETVNNWTSFWAIDITDAKKKAEDDINDNGLWSFSAFYDRPLTKLDDGRFLSIRPWFITTKSTPTGFFNVVDRLNRESGGDYQMWARLFGKATEMLGRKLINDHILGVRQVNEDDMEGLWGKGKVCDCVLIDNDWIALDFVYRRVSKPTTTTGSITDLATDLQRGVFEKLEQIDDTLTRALKVEAEPTGNMFPLVVVGAPFPVNGLLLAEVDKWVLSERRGTIGTNSKCREPLIIDLEEFWALLEAAEHNNLAPAELLRRWSDSPLKVSNFRNWLVTSDLAPVPLNGKRRYHKHAIKHLFGHDLDVEAQNGG